MRGREGGRVVDGELLLTYLIVLVQLEPASGRASGCLCWRWWSGKVSWAMVFVRMVTRSVLD